MEYVPNSNTIIININKTNTHNYVNVLYIILTQKSVHIHNDLKLWCDDFICNIGIV